MIWSFSIRNVQRNVRRSVLTAITITLGCLLLTIALSWLFGIYTMLVESITTSNGMVRISTAPYHQREVLNPIYENLVHTAPLVEQILQVDGVESAHPKISQAVAASREGEELGEVFALLVGAPVDYYERVLTLEKYVLSGDFFTENSDDECLLGHSLAAEMKVGVGEQAIFLGQTQDGSISPIKARVAGIVDTGNAVLDRQAYVPLEQARWMADIPSGATEILVFGTHPATALATQLRQQTYQLEALSGSFDSNDQPMPLSITAWNEREPFASIILIPKFVSLVLSALVIFITGLGVLNTMMMSVLERTSEIGVLRALGMRRQTIALGCTLEAIIIASVGGALGSSLGSIVSIWMERHGLDLGTAVSNAPDSLPINTTLYPNWTPEIATIAFFLSLVMAVIGVLLPAWRANNITPIQAIRSAS